MTANIGIGGGTVYALELLNAFPTTINPVELNNELDGLLQLTVEMSYTRWRKIDSGLQNFVSGGLNFG